MVMGIEGQAYTRAKRQGAQQISPAQETTG
jgi:hypothetical protein